MPPLPIRLHTESIENQTLSPFAARSSESSGRIRPEELDDIRTCFQRDRDRILHSKSFRRLKHKTQVFISPEGDHYRTRLTHTIEVAQIARTVGRALRLNEDLIEAIALGHDVGHTPFGHAGEQALDSAVRESAGNPIQFRHYDQSLRVLMVLEDLNLTSEVQTGIAGHSKGEKDLTDVDGEPTSTLEAAVVRISDRIAYLNHDLDDAVRSGMIERIPKEILGIGQTHGQRVDAMVRDVIQHSLDQPAVRLSNGMLAQMNALKNWLFESVYYHYPKVVPEIEKAKALVRELFQHYLQPSHLPQGYEGKQGAIDYVSGMTDRFAINEFHRLRMPVGFQEF